MAATGLVACGSADDPPGPLTFWAVSMAPKPVEDERILDEVLDEFTISTGMRVEVEVIGWLDLLPRIEVAIASGEGPDVLNIGNTWSASLAETGALLEFDAMALAAVGGRERFLATAMAATGAEGDVPVSVPYLGQAYGLYYRHDSFAEAGVTAPPSTWQEFVAAGKRLTEGGRWGVAFAGAEWTSNSHLAFILTAQHGGTLFDAAGEPSFDTPPVRRAVEQAIGWMDSDRILAPGMASQDRVRDLADDFASGDVAMVVAQSGFRSDLAAEGFDDYGVAPLPTLDPLPAGGEPVRSIVAGTNLAVWGETDQRENALELVDFLTSVDQQVRLNEAFGTLPVVEDAYTDLAFADERLQTVLSVFRDAARPMPAHPDERRMEEVLGGAIAELWTKAAEGRVRRSEIRDVLAAAELAMTE